MRHIILIILTCLSKNAICQIPVYYVPYIDSNGYYIPNDKDAEVVREPVGDTLLLIKVKNDGAHIIKESRKNAEYTEIKYKVYYNEQKKPVKVYYYWRRASIDGGGGGKGLECYYYDENNKIIGASVYDRRYFQYYLRYNLLYDIKVKGFIVKK